MRTATNPNTGEKVQFDDATGEWVPMAQERQAGPDPDVPQVGGAAPADNVDTSGITWPGSGPLAMIGAISPAATELTGAGTALGALAQTKVAAAVIDPVAKALSVASDAVTGKPIDAALWLGEKVPGYIGQKSGQVSAARDTKAILEQVRGMAAQAINPSVGAAGATQRARPGLLASEDLTRQLGLGEDVLSSAQRADLDQVVGDKLLSNQIRQARTAEMEGLYTGAAGPKALENLNKVRTSYTDKIVQEAGFPEGVIPDPGAISDVRRAAGREIGQALEERFPSDVVAMVPEHSFARVIGASTADEAAPTLKLLKNFGAVKGEGDEIVDATDMSLKNYQRLRTELEKLTQTTKNQGIKDTAESVLTRLDATAYEGMDDVGKEILGNARYRYKILSKLQEPGVITNGQINPKSFGKQWMRGESKNMRHFNELATLSDTVAEMAQVASPGTTGKRAIDAVGEGVVGAASRLLGL